MNPSNSSSLASVPLPRGRWLDPSAHGAEAGDSTVVKAIPCNHRVKYLDGQWEDMLYAEEPGYVVVRRETASASGPDDTDNGW